MGGSFLLYVRANFYEGDGGHIYRSVSEIRDDIRRVRELIEEINLSLNIRDMLMRMLSDAASDEPSEWLPELCELAEGAKEGLFELSRLDKTLDELRDELSYTKAALL